MSCELALAEVPRAIRRLASGRRAAEQRGLLAGIPAVLEAISFIALDREILLRAGNYREAYLRTLDAIHVAAAQELGNSLDVFVSYDEHQAEVAEQADLPLAQPGR